MKKNIIYMPLQGRIGNQLFQYSLARKIQLEMNSDTVIVMDDFDILRCRWENSLQYYKLPNVIYQHESIIENDLKESVDYLLRKIYRFRTKKRDYEEKYRIEKSMNALLGRNGMFICENGYIEPKLNMNKPIYLEGYFQSQKYFQCIKDDLLKLFAGDQFKEFDTYSGLDRLRARNSVCISIKVEHNIGNSMYDVCSIKYWKEAIQYIIKNVENPLFFICSDNVDYVLAHLIDTSKYDCVIQDKKQPVHITLAAMSECKHFIIGNTTFGWWAQYLANSKDKIVVAPSRWMVVDMPIDLYEDSWHLVSV